MPKLKTHKGAKRRIHVTGSGKLMRMKQGKSHLRRKKPSRVKHLFDQKVGVSVQDVDRLKRLLPYS
ncbi:MAG: 50S ribosomal protein L35 [Chloroflexi bacterium]|nr:50S ribosomal protein L35 [Chloroflexota bacterium]